MLRRMDREALQADDVMGAQRRRRVGDERSRMTIDRCEACAVLRQVGDEALEGMEGVVEVGRSVRSRNLTFVVVSYGPESCET